ncbi:hypothetical protein [Streptomyces sp. NBC_00503]|uniref:hypothetical protein n=1 Tax=Streptomyces sp. NBC_00503 TaxID=2903659 RepID=UPI002E808A2D|nr:hypothetical protein [Streptomyces sp. NBC_00503]WUD79222.1 hypothetical protein OG490_00770 [Streptomyces sp. NBC_00503]
MRVKRSILGMAGVSAMLFAAAFTTGSAQAAAPSEQSTAAARVQVAPPAPATAAQPTSLVAAASPGISPSAPSGHVPPSGTYGCSSGNLCTLVWDPTTSDWKIFYLNACRLYSVSNWNGNGWYLDNQTGGVWSYFYGSGGGQLTKFQPTGTQTGYDWTPVYSIRNC